MKLRRREVLVMSAGPAALAIAGSIPTSATAKTDSAEKAIRAFTGGREMTAGRVTLDIAEIAENGFLVPLKISVESPMTPEDYVAEVIIVAPANPTPRVIVFKFSPISGAAEAETRIRLAETQEVVAIAKMNDGSLFADRAKVKVTIGGCGTG